MEGNVETNQAINALKGKVISIPSVDNTLSKEGYAADAKVTGEELGKRVEKTDIVDNLTTEDTMKPLSAKQGKVLREMIEGTNTASAGSGATGNSFVEYIGNGDAVLRTIPTNSIGILALLYCSSHCSLVTPKGAWVTDLSTGAISWIDGEKLCFSNGNLLTKTANEACNKADETYYLQVI